MDILNPFDHPMTITPRAGWLHVEVVDKHDIAPSIVANKKLILPEGETRDSLRVVVKVIAAAKPLNENDEQLSPGDIALFAPLVRAVPVPWAQETQMLMRYECVVAVLTPEKDGSRNSAQAVTV